MDREMIGEKTTAVNRLRFGYLAKQKNRGKVAVENFHPFDLALIFPAYLVIMRGLLRPGAFASVKYGV